MAKHPKILIARACFYTDIADMLLAGAADALASDGVEYVLVDVPGAFEIPATIRLALNSGEYDGYIALGCVIRGETTHYDYVCAESAHGLQQLALEHGAAIGYGILTTETMEQAEERANPTKGNKGRDAAEACLRMIELRKQFGWAQ